MLNVLQVSFPTTTSASTIQYLVATPNNNEWDYINGINGDSSNVQNYGSYNWQSCYGYSQVNMQFPNENTANELRVVVVLQCGELIFFTNNECIPFSNDDNECIIAGFSVNKASTSFISSYFPTGNSWNGFAMVIQYAPFAGMIIITNNGQEFSTQTINQYYTTSNSITVLAMQANWQFTNPKIPQLRVVVTLNDGSVQYYPNSLGGTYWTTIQPINEWNNIASIIGVQFSNSSNSAAVVVVLSST